MRYVKPQRVWLKTHPEFNEVWVHDRIVEDPAIIGLGALIVKDRERPQPRAGRLDLLLQDPDTDRRFEVEIQLGATDERHLIRTIEYWDIERKRYPQYDHCAVIIAEDITSRFLNVISLFNSSVPLIAIQMSAFAGGDNISLLFTTVMNEMERGLVEEDEELQEPADRVYWENRAGREMLDALDQILGWLQELDPTLQLKYNKGYVGLARNGVADNFSYFHPRKAFMRVDVKLPQVPEYEKSIEDAGLEVKRTKWGTYQIRIARSDLAKQRSLLTGLFKEALENSRS